jgi:hypothetical protein
MRLKGDKERWETSDWLKTKLSAAGLFNAVQTAFQKAYAEEGPWSPGSFQVTSSGPLTADLHFNDRDGHDWHGTLTLEAVPSDAQQFVLRIATARNMHSE